MASLVEILMYIHTLKEEDEKVKTNKKATLKHPYITTY